MKNEDDEIFGRKGTNRTQAKLRDGCKKCALPWLYDFSVASVRREIMPSKPRRDE